MRRGLLVLVVALVVAGAARAAPPHPDARAFVVLNATDGTVLASENAHEQLPIASITKLMTVVVALQHLKPDDEVEVSKAATHVGGSHIPLRAGETDHRARPARGRAHPERERRGRRARVRSVRRRHPALRRVDERRGAEARLHDSYFVRPDGLDAPGHVSSAHDVAVLAQVAMHSPVVRSIVRKRDGHDRRRDDRVHTWNDLLGVFPGLIGVKTGHTSKAGWCEVAAARRQGYTIYAVILGSPTRAERNADLDQLLAWGVSRYKTLTLVGRTPVAHVALPYGRAALPLVAPRPLVRVVRTGRPVVERVVAPSAVDLPVRQGQVLGRIEVWSGEELLGSRPLLAARSVRRPGVAGRLRWYATRTVHDLWGILS